jgi:GTP-binding protein YchF
MEMGMLGLPLSGKTTLFRLLTGAEPAAGRRRGEAARGVGFVGDPRVTELSRLFKPRKTTYATLTFVDMPSMDLEADRKERNRVLQHIQNSDALLLVVRAFADETVPWPPRYEGPAAQLEALTTELLVRDLDVAETRLTNLTEQARKRKPTPEEAGEKEVLEVALAELEEGRPVSGLGLTAEQLRLVSSCGFFTAKPTLVAVNVDEDQLVSGDYPGRQALEEACHAAGMPLVVLSGQIEAEIGALPEDERQAFMEDLGLTETEIDRLARAAYEHMGLISFLTVGEDEVRAWTISQGTPARAAAGKIHTDLERCFVRAEVIGYETFMTYRSLQEARAHGQIRSVGKEEIIRDGDIVNILANA